MRHCGCSRPIRPRPGGGSCSPPRSPTETVRRGTDHADRAAVLVESALPLDKLVSAHVDDLVAAPDVHAAIGALSTPRTTVTTTRKFIVDGAEGHDLLWYAASELPYLF